MKIAKCKDCKEKTLITGRGLCKNKCYNYHRQRGTLDNYPRSTWKHEDLMAELAICRERGLTVREAAEKIGVTLSALRKAIDRARTRANRLSALWDQDPLERKIN